MDWDLSFLRNLIFLSDPEALEVSDGIGNLIFVDFLV